MKNNKITYILFVVIAIVAIVIIATMGLNFDVKYSNNKQIEVYIGKEFQNKDIEKIVKEVTGSSQFTVQKVEAYEEIALITVKDISDEQISILNSKINEKYELTNSVDSELKVEEVANLRGRDIVTPYIFPVIVSLIIIIIYLLIRYRKVSTLEVFLRVIGFNIFAQVLHLFILAVTRLPINEITMPTSIAIYAVVTLAVFNEFETRQEKEREEENNK